MRVAVLGDVHGNAFALRAVLDEVRRASPDVTVNLGDTLWGAADPGTAWALQLEHAPPTVRGNTDERLAGQRSGKEKMRRWVMSQVPEGVPQTLGALPTFADLAGGEIRVAHGSPRSPWEDLLLTEEGERTRPARRREIRERLGAFDGAVCVVGHTHWEMLAVVDGVSVVNVGPVSRQKDGLPLARWALLTRRGTGQGNAGHWDIEFRRCAYDTQAAAAWARQHGPASLAEEEAQRLLTGREAGGS